MSATLACMAGGSVYRLVQSGQLAAKEIGRRQTPLGLSEPIFLIEDGPAPYYLLGRRWPCKGAACKPNRKANLYALKDLGVEMVLSLSAAGSITHNLSIGQVVVPDDLLDLTHNRPHTFFEDSECGFLRQFPVFCRALRTALEDVLTQMGLPAHFGGTVAVTEGPRLETPAEVRMLATVGAEMVTHSIAPEVFLARELQMCFASACILVNYAETGSHHRPFTTGELFGGLTEAGQTQRLQGVVDHLPQLAAAVAERTAGAARDCPCGRTMQQHIAAGSLHADWRRWFIQD